MRASLSIALLAAVCAFALPACNIPKHLDRASTKAFERSGLVAHTFTDANGPHFVWAAPASGKPKLMLVHGVTSSHAMWSENLAALGLHFDLIVPDLIGHGRSTDTWSGNSVDAQVAHLALILDSLHVSEPVFVVGNSYGGAIAANFAEQQPYRTRGLVIYDGPANAYSKAVADSTARALGAKDILDFFTPADPKDDLRNINAILYEPRKIPRFALRQMHDAAEPRRSVHLGLLKDLIQREDQYVGKRYEWTMPVYVIWGEGDRLIPPSVGRGIMRINELPADHLIMVPKAGHVANIEQPDVFTTDLLRILKDGPCPDPSRMRDSPCTMDYRPVCGCDGRTYPNPCTAMHAGVRVVAEGECK